LLPDFPVGVDPCGEKSGFHACVVARPTVSRRIPVKAGERIEFDGPSQCDLVMAE
jgi:diphthamide synthase (EF-2-diphthine--ammonia ligase)